jgi:hypothetical protein
MGVVAGVSVVPEPEGITGGIVITGIIKTRVKGSGIIIIVTVISWVIIIRRCSFTREAPVEAIVPSLLIHIVRVEAVRVFLKEKRIVACGKAPTVATLHKAHFVGCRLLYANHGIHLRHAGGLQRRRTLISGLVMRVTTRQEQTQNQKQPSHNPVLQWVGLTF